MINTERLFQALGEIHPCSRAFREALSNELEVVVYPRNHMLIEQKHAPYYAYFLETGFAVAYFLNGGKRTVTGFFKPGDILFCPLRFFEQVECACNVQLTVEGELIRISSASSHKLFEGFSEANALSRGITARYYARAEQRIVEMHTLSAWERYVKLRDSYPGIDLNVSQELIASYLNITPQSLSRLRHTRNMT